MPAARCGECGGESKRLGESRIETIVHKKGCTEFLHDRGHAPEREVKGECATCGEQEPEGECPQSRRECGHHCNCSWVHGCCHWCGKEWEENE